MPAARFRTSLDTSEEAQTVTWCVGSGGTPQQSSTKAAGCERATELTAPSLAQTLDKAKLPEDYSGRRCEMLSAN